MTEHKHLALAQVDVESIADALDSGADQEAYLDPATGDIFTGYLGEVLDATGEVLDLEAVDYLRIEPRRGNSSREGYSDMEDFTRAQSDPRLRQAMERALDGKGAFRRFRNVVHQDADEAVGRAWSAFHRARTQLRALEWLKGDDLVAVEAIEAETERLRQAAREALGFPGGAGHPPCLLLINGLPGIGKSTLARTFLDEHPGVLCVDADRLRDWIGGDPDDHAEAARVLALALATAHLATGHDVVMPQLVARIDELARFQAAAQAGGGDLVHLLVTGDVSDDRVPAAARGSLAAYKEGLRQVQQRDHCFAVASRPGDPAGSYAALLDAVRSWAEPRGGGER